MATHDYVIANASGAAVRADLNNALAAIVSNNSNATAPATTYAYQWWADTTANQLKLRNAANDDWIVIQELDGTMLMEDGTAAAPGLAFSSDVDTGLFRPAANQLGIATSGVERVEFGTTEVVFNDSGADVDFRIEGDAEANLFVVDAGNDRIGVGTSSPAYQLHVAGSEAAIASQDSDGTNQITTLQNSAGSTYLTSQNNTTNGIIYFQQSDGTTTTTAATIDSSGKLGVGNTSPNALLEVNSDTDGQEVARFEGDYTASGDLTLANFRRDGGAVAAAIQYHDSLTAMSIGTTTSHNFAVRTNDTERIRVDNSGKVMISTTSNEGGHNLSVAGASLSPFVLRRNGTNGSIMSIMKESNFVGSITVDGSSTSFNTSSDYRLKENVVDLDGAITRVKQLTPKRFNFIVDADKTVDGFLAHEAQTVVPEAVTGTQDEVDEDDNPIYQQIDQAKLVPLLTAALQEAIAKIETLETKVAALEAA